MVVDDKSHLLLKVVKSADVKYPFWEALAAWLDMTPVEELKKIGEVADKDVEARSPKDDVAVKL